MKGAWRYLAQKRIIKVRAGHVKPLKKTINQMKKLVRWVEIPATDFERAVKFYSRVFDLKMKSLDCGSEKMAFLPNDEGAISFAPGFKPSKDGVLVSLDTGDSLDKVIEKVVTEGGKIVQAKTKIEAEGRGYFALFIDSEGNRLGLYGN